MSRSGARHRRSGWRVVGVVTLDNINATCYYLPVIRTFGCKETERLFNREFSRKIPTSIHRVAVRKLWMLDAANELNTLRVPPGNRLEVLSGKRAGQHSIRINDQWRICFVWHDGNAHDVEIVDYH